MNSSTRPLTALVAASALTAASSANVTIVRDVSLAGFSSLAIAEDFESAPLKDASLAAYVHNGLSFTPATADVVVASPGYSNFGVAGVTTSSILASNGDEDFWVVPSTSVLRIGFDGYFNNDPGSPKSVVGASNVQLTVTTATGDQTFSLAAPSGNFGFVGIVSTVPILGLRWYGPGGGIANTGIDNVRVSAVPEPSALSALGLVSAALLRRRKSA